MDDKPQANQELANEPANVPEGVQSSQHADPADTPREESKSRQGESMGASAPEESSEGEDSPKDGEAPATPSE